MKVDIKTVCRYCRAFVGR